MAKYPAFVLAVLLFLSNCFADTFIDRRTGESFNGYIVQKERGNKTQVCIEKKSPRYLDLGAYKIRRNHLGRKNEVFIFSIKDWIELICETEAFEKVIAGVANRGPLFILIEIDTPGGRIDLAQRICAAITRIDNCNTVAFVSGGKFSGAFSAGAMITLACDKVYMREGTAIGAAAPYAQASSGAETIEKVYGQEVGARLGSAWQGYCSAIAGRNDRPGLLVKAMVDKDIEVVEVVENGERLFIDPKNKKPTQSVVRTWSEKGSLLILTAAEAAQCGIADKVVASRDELFAGLAARKAAQVRDTNALKAKREFERAQWTINSILPSISYLEKRAATLVKQVEWERFTTYRDELLHQLLNVFDELIRDYKTALLVAEEYPDLHHYVNTLEKGLKSAEVTFRDFCSRPRYYGPRYYVPRYYGPRYYWPHYYWHRYDRDYAGVEPGVGL